MNRRRGFVLGLLVWIGIGVGGYGQTDGEEASTAGPKIVADHITYHFGRVVQGEVVEHVFKIRNEGNEDLIITSVKPSCGCTSPKWTQKAIAPGEEGEIHVAFNTGGKMGPQKKSIVVYSNAPKPLVLYLEGEVVTSVLRNIYFDYGKATLRPESKVELDRLVKILKENPTMVIEIGGHTDSDGSDEYNLRLSQARAESVMQYLIQAGIEPERLRAKGYGETQPVAPNDTPENKQKNRRTEFKVLKY